MKDYNWQASFYFRLLLLLKEKALETRFSKNQPQSSEEVNSAEVSRSPVVLGTRDARLPGSEVQY